MNYRCVVDGENGYVEYVSVVNGQPQFYELKQGERLVEAPPPLLRTHAGSGGFIRPCFENGRWSEAANAAETRLWEQEHPAPGIASASPQEAAIAQLMREVAQLKLQEVKRDS